MCAAGLEGVSKLLYDPMDMNILDLTTETLFASLPVSVLVRGKQASDSEHP